MFFNILGFLLPFFKILESPLKSKSTGNNINISTLSALLKELLISHKFISLKH
ncbi:hypothetical protein SAMN05421855_10597 [Ulvibacter litoralis]|uniref:Uncharacterized protein n=1 Tax=Ulvibacter litoralis TaxID=227084 RepID=A0A1G7I610_9FLAO|nr:hypothetical protein SAMN05421855_10597 [Ulvibacter litoralis]